MGDTLRRTLSRAIAAVAIAIGFLAVSSAPASANAVCSAYAPDLSTFLAYAWGGGDYLYAGTGYIRDEPEIFAQFEHALQTYCSNQNLAQMLENMSTQYSSWSQDSQYLYGLTGTGSDPRAGFATIATQLFQNGQTYDSYLQQHQNDLANANSPIQAAQATGEINTDIANGVMTMTQLQAAQQANEAIGRAQAYSDAGQMFDLNNSDPSSQFDW